MSNEPPQSHGLDRFIGQDNSLFDIQADAAGPSGRLPLTPEMLRESPSGDLFGLTQNAGMGWPSDRVADRSYLILSTTGGLRAADGSPVALGYHSGHFELDELVRTAATAFTDAGRVPFAASVTDPCDGRTQGTAGMLDSLPYRNDAAIVMRRLIRSLPRRRGVLGVATCDKGLPAMMMALAAMRDLPCVLVPGGVTLPPSEGEDLGTIQTIGARFSHGEMTLDEAATQGCRSCATPGGGCQFFGTAATAQVIAEAMGLALPHSALAPSGSAIWRDVARRSAHALMHLEQRDLPTQAVVTEASLRNAMTLHAAFGGSTNLLLHLPAIAHAAGLDRPTIRDWIDVNQRTPRLVDVLPNGPTNHPTVRLFLAGGVPEVMLHLRDLGLVDTAALTATGEPWGDVLDYWQTCDRRKTLRERLHSQTSIDPDDVIMTPAQSATRGLARTTTFPVGNLAPEGSLIKSTAIAPDVVDDDNVYRKVGPACVFVSEAGAIAAIKSDGDDRIQPGDVIVLICQGPLGAGMQEIYQITSALKHLSFGKEVAVITDGRFSGVSTGACVGHVGPEALAGGPIGKVRDGDVIEIVIDRNQLTGSVNLVGTKGQPLNADQGQQLLDGREPRPDLAPHPDLPDDTKLWATLQQASGGTWGGCVYDADLITKIVTAGTS